MKFLAFNDTHLASAAAESRIDADFPEELFELLGQIGHLAAKLQVRAVLIAGDVFHVRSRCGYEMLARFGSWCQTLQSLGIRVISIPGNHDLRQNRYETLPYQSLGMFYDLGLMENVSVTRGRQPAMFAKDGGAELVAVSGVPFPDAFDLDAWRRASAVLDEHRGVGTHIVLGHCFANLTDGDYWGDPVHSYASLVTAARANVVVLGHDHTDRGVIQLAADQFVCDLGALSRGSSSHDDINREIKVALIDTAPLAITQVRLAYRPAAEIFDLVKKAALVAEREHVQSFVQQLAADLLTQGATPDVTFEQRLHAMQIPGDVLKRTLSYIEAVEQSEAR